MLLQISYGEVCESGTEVLMGRVERSPGCRHRYEIDWFIMKIPAERTNKIRNKIGISGYGEEGSVVIVLRAILYLRK